MTCDICFGLRKVAKCLLGVHCSCTDGFVCGNATSVDCECVIIEQMVKEIEDEIEQESA